MDSVTKLNNLGLETQSPSVLSNFQTLTAGSRRRLYFCPDSQQWPQLPSLHPAINAPRRHDLFVSSGLAPKRPTPSTPASHLQKPRHTRSLPTQALVVAPGAPKLHFYSGRRVSARVRLHLRRVTGNNNNDHNWSHQDVKAADGRSRKWPSCERRKAEKIGSKRCRWNSPVLIDNSYVLFIEQI